MSTRWAIALALIALVACRREPPDTSSTRPTSPVPQPQPTAPTTDTAHTTPNTGHTGHTADTGPTDTGTACPPGAQRRLEGELHLDVDPWATIEGTAGSLLGYAVAGIGDITGDGLADISTIAFLEEHGTDQGGVYVLPSVLPVGTSGARTAGVRLVDATPGTGSDEWFSPMFGSMLPLSDLNGDGLPELALGTYFQNGGGLFDYGMGTVYIVGSPVAEPPGGSFPLDPGYARIRATTALWFGYAMGVGDIDGDTIEDLLVSATKTEDPDGGLRGEVYVFHGPIPTGEYDEYTADFRIYGDNPLPLSLGGPLFMGDQIVVGDLTGDGINDVVVTSAGAWVDGVQSAGEAYVFDGPLTGDIPTSAATGTLQGAVTFNDLGVIANWLGDTDGDGYGEFGLSSTGGLGLVGNAYLLNGPVSGVSAVSDRADTHFYGLQNNDEAAFVASAGDLDQDGLDDVAIGALRVGGDTRGATFLYYGPVPRGSFPVNDAPDATLWGVSGAGWPVAVAAAGDVDGDCMPDLAIGARFGDTVYLLRGGTF